MIDETNDPTQAPDRSRDERAPGPRDSHDFDGLLVSAVDGTRTWWHDGHLHRTDGPAIEHPDGSCEWWVDGQLHRDDGPATIDGDGTRRWWQHGYLHRTDGPAVEHPDGRCEWFIGSVVLTADQHRVITATPARLDTARSLLDDGADPEMVCSIAAGLASIPGLA